MMGGEELGPDNAAVEIVHLAGPRIEFDGISLQRCAWCGALIQRVDIGNSAVMIDERASEEVQREEASRTLRAAWTGFVSVTEGFPRILDSVEEPEDGKAPERSCMRLLPVADEP